MQLLLPWKSSEHYIISVCVCTPKASSMQSYFFSLQLVLSCVVSPLCSTSPHYLINSTIIRNKVFNIKCVLIFSTNCFCNISHSDKN